VAALGFTAPGTPMFFQGDESLAQNGFKWAIPSTWDLGWGWRDLLAEARAIPRLNETIMDNCRRQTYGFYKTLAALRTSSLALSAAGSTARVHTHNDESVLAYQRSYQGDAFVIVASFNRQHLPAHGIDFPSGTWKQILNSNEIIYGGDGFGTNDEISGHASLAIPAAGSLVFRRMNC
jgi:maltooligosyltrehalose trehalohydrolase